MHICITPHQWVNYDFPAPNLSLRRQINSNVIQIIIKISPPNGLLLQIQPHHRFVFILTSFRITIKQPNTLDIPYKAKTGHFQARPRELTRVSWRQCTDRGHILPTLPSQGILSVYTSVYHVNCCRPTMLATFMLHMHHLGRLQDVCQTAIVTATRLCQPGTEPAKSSRPPTSQHGKTSHQVNNREFLQETRSLATPTF